MNKTFAMSGVIFLAALVIIAGCQNGISGMVTAIPEVKDKLAAYPGSNVVLTEWPEDFVTRNIDFITQYCQGMEFKPYVFVELKDSNNAVNSAMLVDKDTKKVACSIDSDLANFKTNLVANIKKTQPTQTAPTTTTVTTAFTVTGKKAKMEFYVMSQCPYGTQVEDGIAPVLKTLGNSVDFSINFIGNDQGNGKFQSLHGENEVKGNIVQLCAMKYNPATYMDMIVCMNKDAKSIPSNWESCAKDNKLDVTKIKTCYEGDEGKTLLTQSFTKANAKQATGSPTMFLNDKPYNGGRDALSFQRAICAAIEGDNAACKDMPLCAANTDCPAKDGKIAICTNPSKKEAKCDYKDDAKVVNIVLNDKTCKTGCDTAQILDVTKNYFPGVQVEYVDIADEKGKQLINELGIIKVPAYLFDKNLVNTNAWTTNQQLQSAFEQKGDYYKLLDEAVGATRYVDDTARKTHYEALGITLGDNKPQMDYFVMSYCPYGNQADEAIEPVYRLLGDSVEFKPHYVIYSDYPTPGQGYPKYCLDKEEKYCSMHGIQELNQNVREICVLNSDGLDKYFKFVLQMNKDCTAQNADSCWEAVAKKLSLDTTKIKDCEKNQATTLLEKEVKLNELFGVSGSPMIFVEGDESSAARTPEGYKQELCNVFDNAPSSCKTTLEGATTASAASAGAGCGV